MMSVMLMIHFTGLAMGVGTGFSYMFLDIAAGKMDKAVAQDFKLKTLFLSKMGHIGLTLLVASGLVMMTPHWSTLTATPLLMIKLALVLVLGALVGILSGKGKKALRGQDVENNLENMAKIGRITLPIGLVIIVLAVLVFR